MNVGLQQNIMSGTYSQIDRYSGVNNVKLIFCRKNVYTTFS